MRAAANLAPGATVRRDRTGECSQRTAQADRPRYGGDHARDGGRSGEPSQSRFSLRMTTIDLTGQIAFVTGSTRGIGLAIARAFHAAGARGGRRGARRGSRQGSRRELRRAHHWRRVRRRDANPGGSRDRRGGGGARADRHPGEQRRTHPRQPPAPPQRRRLGRRCSTANLKGAFHTTRAVIKGMMKRRCGPHHQHHEHRRHHRQQGPGQLRGEQGGADRIHQVGGQGVRQPRHPGELRRAGIHRDRHDRPACPRRRATAY